MQHVIFTLPEQRETLSTTNMPSQVLEDLECYAQVWRKVHSNACISLQPGISQALKYAQSLDSEDVDLHVFVTGTTHLVGPVLSML